MTQIHLVARRINPALKIDLAQIGYVEDGQFVSLPVDVFKSTPLYPFLKSSDVSESLYLNHEDIPRLVLTLCPLPGFGVDYFDNTLVLLFDLNINRNEISSKEEGKGN